MENKSFDRWKRRLLELMYPPRALCVGCGDQSGLKSDWLCETCQKRMDQQWIGAKHLAKLDGAAIAYVYHGPAGSMVRQLKFSGARVLVEPIVSCMLEAYQTIMPTGVQVVVPVPMHPSRQRIRRYNQTELLAEELAKRLELPYQCWLTRVRNTRQQSSLDVKSRLRNLQNAFQADPLVAGMNVLLVDDVLTTGATAQECAKTLRGAGARSVFFVAFASG